MYVTVALQFHKIVTYCCSGSLNPPLHTNGAGTCVSVVHTYTISLVTDGIPSFVHV